jgi:signal transduction histidine kinase/CheY-like chemotaxis protein
MFAICFALLFPGTADGLPPVLRSAHEVRALPLREAGAGRFVALRGTVTFAPRSHNHFYMADETGGVRVEWPMRHFHLNPGDEVRVSGLTRDGRFVPEVLAGIVTVRHATRQQLPKAQRFNLTTDEAYFLDAEWVTADAVVQAAWSPDENWVKLDLARGRGTVVAYVPRGVPVEVKRAQALVGSVVRVRGVWKRGAGGPDPSHLLVSDLAEFVVLEKSKDQGAEPLVTSAALNRPPSDPIDARRPVRVKGVVTLNQNGRHFYLLDETGAVQLRTRDAHELRPGQRVTAHGFPRAADPPILENVTVLSCVTPARNDPQFPAPEPGATASAAAAGKLEGRVATFAGKVLATGKHGEWPTLTVLCEPLTFVAVFVDPPDTVEVGSTVQLTGVVVRQQFDRLPRAPFALVVRPADMKIVAGPPAPPAPPETPPPPWWTGRRVAYLTAGFLGLFLLGGATVTALRVQVRRATALAARRTEEKAQLEGQLGRAAKLEAVGRVAGGVAHDFNNILTVINGCAEMLDEGGPDDPTRAASLANIRRAGRLAAVLSRLLLAFSRQRAAEPRPLDLNALIADAEPILARLLGPKTVLAVAPAPDLPPVLADTGPLLQVLINLAVNAAEAMPNGGTFTLATAAPAPGRVELTATDTGSGMSAEVRARAFERGFTTKAAGTGTGLATVADAVRDLGGQIDLRSEPGRGTEFRIDLPAAPAAPGAAPAALPRAVALVVDDDDGVRAYIGHVLEALGLRVVAHADPFAALRALDDPAAAVDLLVADLVLTGLDGFELAARVRARFPGARVLFVSGHHPDDLNPGGAAGADFLAKPFTSTDLGAWVGRALAR